MSITKYNGDLGISNMTSDELREMIDVVLNGEPLQAGNLPKVKIPAGGGKAWTVPDIGEDKVTSELSGVIIHVSQNRQKWDEDYTGERQPPSCYSSDAKKGIGDPGGDCKTCPFAQFGSSRKGDGQACQLRTTLFILTEGNILPVNVNLPPTSNGAWKNYSIQLLSKMKPYFGVVTGIKLEAVQNGGQTYSRAVFTAKGALTPEQKAQIDGVREVLVPMLSATSLRELSMVTNPPVHQFDPGDGEPEFISGQ